MFMKNENWVEQAGAELCQAPFTNTSYEIYTDTNTFTNTFTNTSYEIYTDTKCDTDTKYLQSLPDDLLHIKVYL